MRHAIAEEAGPGASARADAARRLTREGRRRMRLGAAGLRVLVPGVDVLASSPLVRAVQTAALVAGALGVDRRELLVLPTLAPGARSRALLPWLAAQAPGTRAALVGHEPHLARLAALLLHRSARGGGRIFALRKGGACLLDLAEPVRPGSATLRWLATARALRILGGSDADRS